MSETPRAEVSALFLKDAQEFIARCRDEGLTMAIVVVETTSAELAAAKADRQRELDACPYCQRHKGSPCFLHGGGREAQVVQGDDGGFELICPVCGVPSDEVRHLKAENERLREVLDNVLRHYSGPQDVYEDGRRALSGEGE